MAVTNPRDVFIGVTQLLSVQEEIEVCCLLILTVLLKAGCQAPQILNESEPHSMKAY